MANALYAKAKEGILNGTIDLSANTIRAMLVDTATYTVNLATHNAYDDLSGIVGTESDILGSKTFVDGVFDGSNLTFNAVTGTSAEALVLFVDSGTPATDYLIAYIDTATGLPVTPNSGDITVTWNASGIFSL